MLPYHRGDERPAWVASVIINGEADDMSSGYDFRVDVAPVAGGISVLSKTTGIVGGIGTVTTTWAPNDLDLPPGNYEAHLVVRRTIDSHEWTIDETIAISPRNQPTP